MGLPIKPQSVPLPRCILSGVVDLHYIGKRPVLVGWRLRVLCYLYKRWGLSDLESISIFTDEAEARRAATRPGYFYQTLPLNKMLPDEPCQYKTLSFPASVNNFYPERRLRLVAVDRETLDTPAIRITPAEREGLSFLAIMQKILGQNETPFLTLGLQGKLPMARKPVVQHIDLSNCWAEAREQMEDFERRLEELERLYSGRTDDHAAATGGG